MGFLILPNLKYEFYSLILVIINWLVKIVDNDLIKVKNDVLEIL